MQYEKRRRKRGQRLELLVTRQRAELVQAVKYLSQVNSASESSVVEAHLMRSAEFRKTVRQVIKASRLASRRPSGSSSQASPSSSHSES